MRTITVIRQLLEALNTQPADELENEDLDFKEWNSRSMAVAVALVVEMAICSGARSPGVAAVTRRYAGTGEPTGLGHCARRSLPSAAVGAHRFPEPWPGCGVVPLERTTHQAGISGLIVVRQGQIDG
jgi:hypothetical protein